MTTLLLPTLVVPLVGLAYDATVCYIVQSELSMAVDGAALGGGRLLGAVSDPTNVAKEYLVANFRVGSPGFWGAKNLSSSVVYTPGTTKIITINAAVDVPLTFLWVFGWDHATVGASGQASRRDSRVIMVIDRSGSMADESMTDANGNSVTVAAEAKVLAAGFVKNFIPGTDELGLVVFDGSAVVGYPANYAPGSWTQVVTAASKGGPDTAFWDGTSANGSATGGTGGAGDMIYEIGQIAADSATGTADALSVAYVELQKAHMRDLAANNGVDTRMNSIILFTDGVPSAVSWDMNNPNHAWLLPSARSYCVNAVDDLARDNPMYFFTVFSGPPYGIINSPRGTPPYSAYYRMATLDATAGHTATWYMNDGGTLNTKTAKGSTQDLVNPGGNAYNSTVHHDGQCISNLQNFSAVSTIPTLDLYGNNTDGTGGAPGIANSQFVTIGAAPTYTLTVVSDPVTSGGTNFTGDPTSAQQWGLALWNAADSAGYRIRTDANYLNRGDTAKMPITIYAIGFQGESNLDWGFLLQLANDARATAHTTTGQQTGIAYLANDFATLQNAFSSIISSILHLSQ